MGYLGCLACFMAGVLLVLGVAQVAVNLDDGVSWGLVGGVAYTLLAVVIFLVTAVKAEVESKSTKLTPEQALELIRVMRGQGQ